ncbi:MAG: hypothetical protein Q7S12_00200 [bacterium]|nr:hypothetical protein [bacterium]
MLKKNKSPEKIIEEWYKENENGEGLKEKNQHLSYENFLTIGLDFLECKAMIETAFPGVRGFMFSKKQLRFIVDASVDEGQKKAIRETCIGFVTLNKILKSINKTAEAKR